MIVSTVVTLDDFEFAKEWLLWLQELGGCDKHFLFMYFDPDMPWEEAKELLEIAHNTFRGVSVHYGPGTETEHSDQLIGVGLDYIPVKHGWIDQIAQSCYGRKEFDCLPYVMTHTRLAQIAKKGQVPTPEILEPTTVLFCGDESHALLKKLQKKTPQSKPRIEVKPYIPVTLVCVDTDKPHLAQQAIDWCLKIASFDDVKLLTDRDDLRYAQKIHRIYGVEGYSNFMIRELNNYIHTDHCLVVQWDGYILNPAAWKAAFLKFDYIGAPALNMTNFSGNGGFSLRSKKLVNLLSKNQFLDNPHPEDAFICVKHRKELTTLGIQFCEPMLSRQFAYEGRKWNGTDWVSHSKAWSGEFGFHSFLTKLPPQVYRPNIYHHTGDMGDVIYSLPTIKAIGPGMLWLSPENHFAYPLPTHTPVTPEWAASLASLLNLQDYIFRCQYTPAYPHSTDYDLNSHRAYYIERGNDKFNTLFRLHLMKFKVDYPEDQPWLTVDRADTIEGRPIMVNRTQRWNDPKFDWTALVKNHKHQMFFVGTSKEYEMFRKFDPHREVPYVKTPQLLDLARLIQGCKVFVGNQSTPMAIAFGLNKPVIQETWPLNRNCVFKRDNALYSFKDKIEIPDSWLS